MHPSNSTRQNPAIRLLQHSRAKQASSNSVILPCRNSILHRSQHPRSPYSNSQTSSTVLHYRILPGEIGFIPRVKYCISNTILRSVYSKFTCYKKFNSIQSSSYSMRRYSTLSSIQVVLVAILHKLQ